MIYISHRGNIDGPIPEMENKPEYIDNSILEGYQVEIDVWYIDGNIFLGHDEPNYKVDINWLSERSQKLWVHCKNIESMVFLLSFENNFNFFWHQSDLMTLTSKNFMWVYPGKQKIKNSVAVLPELYNDDISDCYGVCSDYIKKYKEVKSSV